jgi:hypothetical protein
VRLLLGRLMVNGIVGAEISCPMADTAFFGDMWRSEWLAVRLWEVSIRERGCNILADFVLHEQC